MTSPAKFRVQAGALLFEIEGSQAFVKAQLQKHQSPINTILEEQARLIKSGIIPLDAPARRRGRPPKGNRPTVTRSGIGRRPGRQPVIIRHSDLKLKPRALGQLRTYLAGLAGEKQLAKDATVFAIAHYLCTHILKSDTFTAGDIGAIYRQLGHQPYASAASAVDVVQMLRNLSATSIGKVWVVRNADGTFALTGRGKAAGDSGAIVQPRGRRPGKKTARRGRPPKQVAARRGRPPKKRLGRPPKKVTARRGRPPKARRGRPPVS